jgi:hypothetical protein
MNWHLQNSIMFFLLPFLPWATVPRIVIIWGRNQSSQAAFRAAGTEGAVRGGSKRRPPFSLLILQLPFTNSRKYFAMLQGVTWSEKQAVIQLVWRLQTKKKWWSVARHSIAFARAQTGIPTERFLQASVTLHTGSSKQEQFKIIWPSRSQFVDLRPLEVVEFLWGICMLSLKTEWKTCSSIWITFQIHTCYDDE